MIEVPGLGINDIVDSIGKFSDWYDNRKLEKHKLLWERANLIKAYDWIVSYYESIQQNLVKYNYSASSKYFPILQLLKWNEISDKSLLLEFNNHRPNFTPSKTQKIFYDFFSNLKKLKPIDLDVFSVKEIKISSHVIKLFFELGSFSQSVMCQYILEDELMNLLDEFEEFNKNEFLLRNSVAENYNKILNFYKNNITRIGFCTLILLKKDDQHYIPMVKKRGESSMINQNLFDPISSCVFEVATTPKADFELKHTLMREIYEELFGQKEVAEDVRHINPYYFYERDGIKDLNFLLENGRATFAKTGFCIDLIRLVPEITAVLVVQDQEYFDKYFNENQNTTEKFILNDEFNSHSSHWEIPISIKDAERYLKDEILSDPDSIEIEKGFDPMKWTLPGGYSFYQGICYAVHHKLLK